MNNLTDTEKAYIAGFMDGEGCITISKYQGKNSRTPAYSMTVILSQKGNNTLRDIFSIVGCGSLNESRKSDKGSTLRFATKDATELLEMILPYLKNKYNEAILAIEFANKQGHKTSGGRGWIVPPDVVQEKEEYYLQMREMKGSSSIGRGRPK